MTEWSTTVKSDGDACHAAADSALAHLEKVCDVAAANSTTTNLGTARRLVRVPANVTRLPRAVRLATD